MTRNRDRAIRHAETVYAIAAAEFVKIGTTRNLQGRLDSLATGCPFPLEVLGSGEGGRGLERQLHARLKHARAHGEWFILGEEQRAELLAVLDSPAARAALAEDRPLLYLRDTDGTVRASGLLDDPTILRRLAQGAPREALEALLPILERELARTG